MPRFVMGLVEGSGVICRIEGKWPHNSTSGVGKERGIVRSSTATCPNRPPCRASLPAGLPTFPGPHQTVPLICIPRSTDPLVTAYDLSKDTPNHHFGVKYHPAYVRQRTSVSLERSHAVACQQNAENLEKHRNFYTVYYTYTVFISIFTNKYRCLSVHARDLESVP